MTDEVQAPEPVAPAVIPESIADCRFIRVAPNSKRAIDPGWQDTANYAADDPAIQIHLTGGGNYGVMPSGNIAVLDVDDFDAVESVGIFHHFKGSLRVQTGNGLHIYFRISGEVPAKKIPLFHPSQMGKDGKPAHIGEVYLPGAPAYVVGPGCNHPSGRKYQVTEPGEMVTIPADVLFNEILSRFKYAAQTARDTTPQVKPLDKIDWNRVGKTFASKSAVSLSDKINLQVADVLRPEMGENSYQTQDEMTGSHPIHGSTGGHNLSVNIHKNSWYCHRCGTGGGPLEAAAVAFGIIDCSQAGRVKIVGDLFKQVKSRLREMPTFREKIEQDDQEYRESHPRVAPENPTGSTPEYDQDIEEEAAEIIRTGRILEYMQGVFKTIHAGDLEVCSIITLAGAAGACLTTKGIQPFLTGVMGTGKSSAIRSVLHLWPREFVISGEFSNRGLFYDEDLKPGAVIWPDDWYTSPEIESLVKRSMSNFQCRTDYTTVAKGPGGVNVGVKKSIPPRLTYIFSATADAGSGELLDRQYRVSLVPSEESDKAYLEFFYNRLEQAEQELPESREVMICRSAMRQIKEKLFKVKIPYIRRLNFTNIRNKRDMEMFADFLQAVTILNYQMRRTEQDDQGIITIYSDETDFRIAQTIFQTNDTGGMALKLNKSEQALLEWMATNSPDSGLPEQMIVREYGDKNKISRTTIRNYLYGRDFNGGICGKVPGAYFIKETRTADTGEHSRIGKTMNVIHIPSSAQSAIDGYTSFVTLRGGGTPDTPDTRLTPHDTTEMCHAKNCPDPENTNDKSLFSTIKCTKIDNDTSIRTKQAPDSSGAGGGDGTLSPGGECVTCTCQKENGSARSVNEKISDFTEDTSNVSGCFRTCQMCHEPDTPPGHTPGTRPAADPYPGLSYRGLVASLGLPIETTNLPADHFHKFTPGRPGRCYVCGSTPEYVLKSGLYPLCRDHYLQLREKWDWEHPPAQENPPDDST